MKRPHPRFVARPADRLPTAITGERGLNVSFCLPEVAFDEITEHTPPMLSSTHNQRVLDLASQKGLLRASDLDA
ncbi:hypothetical protein FBQ88_12700, partial [Gammaproteobacteria bacterium PRO2]|nr:hypothetical protein [Gammaproteobacteria bacterium PRO2]